MGRALSTEEFIARARARWEGRGHAYDYDATIYRNSTSPVSVRCHEHGEFTVNARNHLNGRSGCPACQALERERRTMDFSRFWKLASARFADDNGVPLYDYEEDSWGDPELPSDSVRFRCPIHGEQLQRWFNHLAGKGCPRCVDDHQRLSDEEVQALLDTRFSGEYRLIPGSYRRMPEPFDLLCAQHGAQRGYLANLIRGRRPLCCARGAGRSRGERELYEFLLTLAEDFEHSNRTLIAPYELDAYSPSLALAVEYNGDYRHSDQMIRRTKGIGADEYHERKRALCVARGVRLVFLWESRWREDSEGVKRELSKLCGELAGALETPSRGALLPESETEDSLIVSGVYIET